LIFESILWFDGDWLMRVLPCDCCLEFDEDVGLCRVFDEFLFNGFAKLFFSRKCGRWVDVSL
jgi:hypothetical protein